MFITHLSLKPTVASCITANDKLVTAHSWVSDSLKTNNTHPKRYLWRLNRKTDMLIIVSTVAPNKLVLQRYGDLTTFNTQKYSVPLYNDQLYDFALFANPTKRNAQTHKIEQLQDSDAQKQWLIKKAKNNGFELCRFEIQDQNNLTLLHNHQSASTIVGIEFNGQLRITDKKLFAQALVTGIGREKSYGLGLLLIEPIE